MISAIWNRSLFLTLFHSIGMHHSCSSYYYVIFIYLSLLFYYGIILFLAIKFIFTSLTEWGGNNIVRNAQAAGANYLPRPKLTTVFLLIFFFNSRIFFLKLWCAGLSFSKCHAELNVRNDINLHGPKLRFKKKKKKKKKIINHIEYL